MENQSAQGKKHKGHYLKWMVEKYQPVITRLERHMEISRGYIYKLYDEHDLKWDYLRKAAEFIGHDILKDYPDMPVSRTQLLQESEVFYGNITLVDCIKERNQLKDQVIELQKKIIEMAGPHPKKERNGLHS